MKQSEWRFVDDLLGLILMSLGAWRLAVLLVREDGPFLIVRRLRMVIGIDHDDNGVPISWPDRFPAQLFECVWCMSIWTAGLMVLLWWLCPVVVWVAGVAGLAALIETLREKNQE